MHENAQKVVLERKEKSNKSSRASCGWKLWVCYIPNIINPIHLRYYYTNQCGHICSFDIQPPTALHHVACWLNATHITARDDRTCKWPKIGILKSRCAKYCVFTLFYNFHENLLRSDETTGFLLFYRQRLTLTRCGLSVTYKDLKRKHSPGLYSSFHFNGPGPEWVA